MSDRLGTLVTFGYAGLASPEDLRRHLTGRAVDVVFDIRLNRWSSILAFSGRTRATVETAGFRYVPCPALGNVEHRSAGTKIKDIEAVELVLDEIRHGHTAALMCGCRESARCHRTDVSAEAHRREPALEIVHV